MKIKIVYKEHEKMRKKMQSSVWTRVMLDCMHTLANEGREGQQKRSLKKERNSLVRIWVIYV